MKSQVSEFDMKAIINDCINNNFHIFLAFDVVDGKLTPREYFNKVIEESNRKRQKMQSNKPNPTSDKQTSTEV